MDMNREVGDSLVLETDSGGVGYARITLRYDFRARAVVARSAEIVSADADAVAPDPEIEAFLAPYREELSQAFDSPIASCDGVLERGDGVERLGEVPIGNLVADAVRERYATDIGFVNGGGIRAPLPSSYAPADQDLRRPAEGYAEGPPYDLVIGDVYAVLPFGNVAITRTVTGESLWAMLEHGVEALPAPAGSFGQVSGLSFTFDSTLPPGSRVLTVTLDDGSAVPQDGTAYTLATSDFIAAGGDGYEMLANGDGVARDKLAEVLREHIELLGSIVPTTEGRIVDVSAP